MSWNSNLGMMLQSWRAFVFTCLRHLFDDSIFFWFVYNSFLIFCLNFKKLIVIINFSMLSPISNTPQWRKAIASKQQFVDDYIPLEIFSHFSFTPPIWWIYFLSIIQNSFLIYSLNFKKQLEKNLNAKLDDVV